MSRGYVYVLSNPSMPGLIKIGRTNRDVEQRSNELWSTGVPTPFVIEFSILSPNSEEMEIRAHEMFDADRVLSSREFFVTSVEAAISHLENDLIFQVQSIVDDYLPEFSLAEEFNTITPELNERLCDELNCSPYDASSAIHFMEPSEFSVGMDRWNAHLQARKAEREAQKEIKLQAVQ